MTTQVPSSGWYRVRSLSCPHCILLFIAASCGCVLPSCSNSNDASVAARGKELRPLGFFVSRELPNGRGTKLVKSRDGEFYFVREQNPPPAEQIWTFDDPLQRYLVIIVGVPGSWVVFPNLPLEAKSDEKAAIPGLDPNQTHGSHPRAFKLRLGTGKQLPGQFVSILGVEHPKFNNNYTSSSPFDPGDLEVVEMVFAIGWEVGANEFEPLFRIQFSDKPEATVPQKRFEYPAVLNENFSTFTKKK